MAAELLAGLSAFKTMFDIAKSMKDMSDAVNRNAAVADLWEQIIAAQTRYTAAIEQVNELETKLGTFEKWEADKKRYQMKDFGGGTIAYELKQSEAGDEPMHRICPNCYQEGHKSILQNTGITTYKQQLSVCHRCKTEFKFGERQEVNLSARSNYNPRI